MDLAEGGALHEDRLYGDLHVPQGGDMFIGVDENFDAVEQDEAPRSCISRLCKAKNDGTQQLDHEVETAHAVQKMAPTGLLWAMNFVIFVIPVIINLLWLLIPLCDPATCAISKENVMYFAISHSVYALIAAMFAFSVFDLAIPHHLLTHRYLMAIISGLLVFGVDYAFYDTLPENYIRWVLPTSIFPTQVVCLLSVVVRVLMMDKNKTFVKKVAGAAAPAAAPAGAARGDAALTPSSTAVPADYTESGVADGTGAPSTANTSDEMNAGEAGADAVTGVLLEVVSDKTEEADPPQELVKERTYLLWQLVRLALFGGTILIIYYYCQLYIALYRLVTESGNKTGQTIMGGAFAWTLLPLDVLLKTFTSRIDQNSSFHPTLFKDTEPALMRRLGLTSKPFIGPLAFWVMSCFEHLFYRNLFTTVQNTGVFIATQVLFLARDLILYPLRMSDLYRRFRKWIAKKRGQTLVLKMDLYRNELSLEFFFICMAQRLSILSFVVSLYLLRYTYNGYHYNFSRPAANCLGLVNEEGDPGTMCPGQFQNLLNFSAIMFASEFLQATIIYLVARRLWNKDVVLLGAQFTLTSRITAPALYFAVHVLQDVYLSINRLDFPTKGSL